LVKSLRADRPCCGVTEQKTLQEASFSGYKNRKDENLKRNTDSLGTGAPCKAREGTETRPAGCLLKKPKTSLLLRSLLLLHRAATSSQV